MNREVTSKNIANCTEILEYRNFEKVLYKIKCEWESQIKKKVEQRNTVIGTNPSANCTYMDSECKGKCCKTGDSSSSIGGLYRLETEHRNVHSGSTYFHIQVKPDSNCGLKTSLTDDFHSLFVVPPHKHHNSTYN